MSTDRRLIEDFIPIREISAEAAREKSIRKGHISTLHLWWARRPLVAARAAVFAALVAAPETYQKRTCLKKTMIDLCRWEAGENTVERAKKKILEAQRERLNLPADTPLNEVPVPKVLDIFAGGGAIPLEALRLGCETYAVDLNPVAHIIELCTLVYPQNYGKKLAVEVEKWGNWVIENVRAEIGDLYPGIPPHPLAPSPTRGEGGLNDRWEISESLHQRMVEVARNLRKNQTPTEAILWQHLRGKKRGYKVRRQQPIGICVVDFYIPQCRLIVEIDGSIHAEQQEKDRERQLLLEELGLKFIRFSTTQVEQNINQVLETIDAKVTTLTSSLNPSHLGREANSTPLSHQGRGAGGEGVPYGSEIESEDVQLELLPSSKPKQLSLAKTLTPVAYLWTRTVKCPNPACGAAVPLVRQTWLCKKSKKYVALKVTPNYQTKQVEFEVVESTTEKGLGFDPAAGSTRGNSVCRHCGTAIPSKPYIQEQGKAGKISYQLMAIVCTTPSSNGKTYLSGTTYEQYIPDEVNIKNDLKKLVEETEISTPNEPVKVWSGVFNAPLYGLDKFEKLFTTRQLLALMTFVKWVRLAHVEMMQQGYEEEFGKAIATYLGIMCDKQAMFNCSLTRWFNHREGICPVFSNQALPMVWDFIEGNPLCSGSGSWESAQQYVKEVILSESNETNNIQLQRGSAISLPFESSSLDAVITDPPYFDSVPYADLSDFFYVWLKRSIGHLYAEHFSGQLTPKKNEAIMEPSRHGGDKSKAAKAYEDMMHKAFCESSRVLKPGGVMVVVYAHKTTSGWVTLIDSLRRAGFTITEAWPLDTEMGSRLRGQNSAALASSIFLVARKRPHPASGSPLPILGEGLGERIGDYAMEVKPQLAEIVKERVKTLMEEGVTDADLIIACVGAGLRAYTQYDRVELPNGDELDAQTFLDEVQKEVLETILADVLFCDKRGVSAVDKPTQYYILGRYEYGEAIVEFDEANTLARGVINRTQEQRAIDTLLASWKRLIEDNLFTQSR